MAFGPAAGNRSPPPGRAAERLQYNGVIRRGPLFPLLDPNIPLESDKSIQYSTDLETAREARRNLRLILAHGDKETRIAISPELRALRLLYKAH
jgi:hypothetical protein